MGSETLQYLLVAQRAEWLLGVTGLPRILEKMLLSGTAPFLIPPLRTLCPTVEIFQPLPPPN